MAYRLAKDEEGNPQAFRSAVGPDGQKKWFPVGMDTVPETVKSNWPVVNAKVDAGFGRSEAAKNKERERQISESRYLNKVRDTRGEAAVDRAIDAQDRPLVTMGDVNRLIPDALLPRQWENLPQGRAAIVAGREMNKLGAGIADIKDFATDVMGDPNAIDRTVERQRTQGANDEVYKEMGENEGIATLAASLPYMVSGTLAGPTLRNAYGTVSQGINRGVQYAGRTTRGLARRGTDKLADMPGPVGKLGQRVNEEIMDPVARAAMRRANRLPERNFYRENALPDLLGGTALGAVEGGLHYDYNPIEGATAGLFGGATGQFLRRPLAHGPDRLNTTERAVMDWGEDAGMKFLPGLKYGSRRNQMFEHGLRSDATWADLVGAMDDNNVTLMNRKAMNAAGFSDEVADNVTPEMLQKHMDDLSAQYTKLESSSTGRFTGNSLKDLNYEIAQLQRLRSDDAQKAFRVGKDYLDKFKKMYTVQRDKRGRFQQATFDGTQYQQLRKELKSDIDSAYKRGDDVVGRTLKPFLESLDDAMDRGVRDFGGESTAAQWRDLNEQFAISKLVMNKGLTPTGNYDPQKMLQHLRTNDIERMVTGKGGRISELHKLSQLQDMMNRQQGSDFSGTNLNPVAGQGRSNYLKRMLASGTDYVPLLPSLAFGAYRRGWPGQKGILAMNHKGPWSPQVISRAMAQGTKVHPTVIQSGVDTAQAVYDAPGDLLDWVREWWPDDEEVTN